MQSIPAQYHVYGREVAPTTFTPHLQGFITFKKSMRLSALKKFNQRACWSITRDTSHKAAAYCKKEDPNPFERGSAPTPGSRTDIHTACEMIKAGKTLTEVATECSTVFVKYGRGLRDLKLTLDAPYQHESTRGYWYWGAPGTGKSYKARMENPEAYIKSQNKWWDNYQGESCVILDDMDSNMLGHLLKIWADRYPCTGETKGGTVNLRYAKFIVTSNYSIESLWEDEEMRAAIRRRFKVTHFTEPFKYLKN
jgi:hypothetical protein